MRGEKWLGLYTAFWRIASTYCWNCGVGLRAVKFKRKVWLFTSALQSVTRHHVTIQI